jgi:hypothetical protein
MPVAFGAFVEADVLNNPAEVALLGAGSVALDAETLTDLIEELPSDSLRGESAKRFSGIGSTQPHPWGGIVSC